VKVLIALVIPNCKWTLAEQCMNVNFGQRLSFSFLKSVSFCLTEERLTRLALRLENIGFMIAAVAIGGDIQKHAHASIQRDLKSKSNPYFISKSHRNCCKSGLLVRIMYWPHPPTPKLRLAAL
jgi:hypothetical protein